MSSPVTSVARVEDVKIFLKGPVCVCIYIYIYIYEIQSTLSLEYETAWFVSYVLTAIRHIYTKLHRVKYKDNNMHCYRR